MPSIQKALRILEFIKRYFASNHEAPTLREIGNHFNMNASSSVYAQLQKLQAKGLITKIPNVSRGTRIVEEKRRESASN